MNDVVAMGEAALKNLPQEWIVIDGHYDKYVGNRGFGRQLQDKKEKRST